MVLPTVRITISRTSSSDIAFVSCCPFASHCTFAEGAHNTSLGPMSVKNVGTRGKARSKVLHTAGTTPITPGECRQAAAPSAATPKAIPMSS
eukprot:1482933-Prymnesium_polylepis.1